MWRGVVAVAIAVLVGGCTGQAGESPAGSPPERPVSDLDLRFDDGLGEVVTGAENSGVAQVKATVAAVSGGRIDRAEGRDGGHALRFPAFTAGPSPARAVLKVVSRGSDDALDPGDASFRFGADFRLDEQSGGSKVDNGDNLIQRGLFGEVAQYKIQLDRRSPSCRIVGGAGEVLVKSGVQVSSTSWYRVSCERRAGEVVLELTEFEGDGSTSTQQWVVEGDVGAVAITDPLVPMSVGGKLARDGEVVKSSTDQFNGVVDNVFYELVD